MPAKYLPYLFFTLIIFSCTDNNDKKATDILRLKEMSDLVTTEYVVTKIIKASDNKTWFKIGERKILMSCKASLKAGIDISQITQANVSVNNDQIHISLPHAHLISINILPDDIKTEYEEVSAFRSSFTATEKNELAKQAETNIKNSIDSLGVLKTAEINATLYLSSFFQQLGYQKVFIDFQPQHPSLQ